MIYVDVLSTNKMRSASDSPAWEAMGQATRPVLESSLRKERGQPMLVLADPDDSRAVRNKDNILAVYDLLISKKKQEEAAATFIGPVYIEHNPVIADGGDAGAKFFGKVAPDHAQARGTAHKIIAAGDYVWGHVHFLNLLDDNPQDTGVAGVDIFKMDAEGKAIEHWDVLQVVGDPKNAAPWFAPNVPRADRNVMF